jgi:hypothetical protein
MRLSRNRTRFATIVNDNAYVLISPSGRFGDPDMHS